MNYPSWVLAAAAVLGVLNTIGVAWIVWSIRALIREQVAAALDGLIDDLAKVEQRLLVHETRAEALPTRDDLHQLAIALRDATGELKAMGVGVTGLKDTLSQVRRDLDRHENILASAARGG